MAAHARPHSIYDAESGEIDRTELKSVAAAFVRLHARRLADAKATMSPSKRRVLESLPVLMHMNHSLLPGFCGHRAPAGIDRYRPSAQALHILRSFTRIRIDRLRAPKTDIRAVYLMGSTGSIAQTRASDLDVWIVADESAHRLLNPKVERISAWAAELGVELQAFCVDPGEFRRGGPGQRTSPLLLDEFYRSAIHVAGRFPLWWLIPPEADYPALAERMLHHRFVNPDHYLDFGPVADFSSGELLEATLAELERSQSTPHKSLLKLASLACYASGATPLSTEFKRRVLVDTEHGSDPDSYILLADILDDQFSGVRRDTLRRAWLTKTVRANSHLNRSNEWRVRAEKWGYDDLDIDRLRWPERWSLTDLIAEQHRLLEEYAHAFAFALRLASELAPSELRAPALDKLRRIAFELRPHFQIYPKTILPALLPKHYQGHAEVRQTRQGAWLLRDAQSVIHEHPRLVGALSWMTTNGLSLEALTFTQRRDPRLQQIYSALARKGSVAIINAESTALLPIELDGKSLVTPLDDPLSYGVDGAVLIKQVDVVDSTHTRMTTFDDVRDCLCALVSLDIAGKAPAIFAVGDIRRHRLQQRLRLLAHDATRTLKRGNVYRFALGHQQCFLYWDASNAFPSCLSLPKGYTPTQCLPNGARVEIDVSSAQGSPSRAL